MTVEFTPSQEVPEAPKEPTPKKRGRPTGTTKEAKIETELRQDLTMLMKMGALAWSVKDPVCGPVLNQQSELIAGDIAKFVARQSWARKWLDNNLRINELIQLFIHAQPVLMAIYAHHVGQPPAHPDGVENWETEFPPPVG